MKLHVRDSINGSLHHREKNKKAQKIKYIRTTENYVFILFFSIQANKGWGYCFPVLALNILNMLGIWGR